MSFIPSALSAAARVAGPSVRAALHSEAAQTVAKAGVDALKEEVTSQGIHLVTEGVKQAVSNLGSRLATAARLNLSLPKSGNMATGRPGAGRLAMQAPPSASSPEPGSSNESLAMRSGLTPG